METPLAAHVDFAEGPTHVKMASGEGVAVGFVAQKSNYYRSLEGDVSIRYQNKINLLLGRDPYTIGKGEWSSDNEKLPPVTYPDILYYLVYQKSAYTLNEFKAFKSLESLDHVKWGWVQEIKSIALNGYYLISGKVLHSQKLRETPLSPWVIVESDGVVNCAHCTCMAGLGECCTHVAAVLFYVEAAVRHRKGTSVTQVLAYWKPPSSKGASYARVSEMDYSRSKRKCEVLSDITSHTNRQIVPNSSAVPSTEELHGFLEKLNNTGTRCAILSVVEPFCNTFTPKQKPIKDPLLLTSFFEECNEIISLKELVIIGRALDLGITEDQASYVENSTRQQAECKRWFQFRAGRITASKFKSACRVRSAVSSPSLIKAICYPEQNKFKNKAVEWGCTHEKIARKAYVEINSNSHKNLSVKDAGLHLNPKYPQFGATPDALLKCDCCGKGCLEIKCPYCIKDSSIEERLSEVSCIRKDNNGLLKLDRNHAYFFQIQAQLYISQREYCDFVIWACKGNPHIERVWKDEEFWNEEAPKASTFFFEALLPELLGHYFTRKVSDPEGTLEQTKYEAPSEETQWCICKKEKEELMVMCEREGCDIVWYHKSCAKLKIIPKGKWFCTKCKSRRKN